MADTLSPPPLDEGKIQKSRSRSFPRLVGWLALTTLLFIALVALLLVVGLLLDRHAVPSFPSLARHPDPALRGTVAYFADSSGCVRIRAAAGQPVRDVYCIPPQDVSKAAKQGKEIGPQLVWLPHGRLEVTMFRMTPPPGPRFEPGWQKIVDVRTGKIWSVPRADVPSEPDRQTHPMVGPSGQRISWTSDNGRIEVVLHSGSGSRTLLSVRGPGEYTYGLYSAFWAANGQWVAADDGRILVITTGRHPVTRVLTSESGQVGFDGRLSRFAVTGADLLPPTK